MFLGLVVGEHGSRLKCPCHARIETFDRNVEVRRRDVVGFVLE